ncbi:MAG: hypothetical protein GF364_10730 [Candidatus Lokiarchaeota archaeon]|nr:hypothetical protein [Candidatus Lokiarchaeota archaeon]
MNLPLDLEYYPKISEEILKKNAEIITKNMEKWSKPFFMDVYSYSDLDEFRKVAAPFLNDQNLENLIILGTGGSIQTALTLSKLFKKKFYPIVSSRPEELVNVLSDCPPEKSLVIPISRGGKTLDVNSTLTLFRDYPMLALSSQGPMYEYLKKQDIPILPVPDLSGRFAASICSVGLIPSLIAGVNVDEFLNSLAESYSVFKDLHDTEENLALHYASLLKMLYNKGYTNIFNMPYSVYLEGAAGLFVQEISESSGKKEQGLLGTYQPAPLCQHSVLELLLGGKKGHTSPFIWTTLNEPQDIEINSTEFGLVNQTALNIIKNQADATFQALIGQNIPVSKIELYNISEESYASLIAFIQSTVYYFCMLLDVNWANNPLVVTGKEICNEAIKEGKTRSQRKQDREELAEKKYTNFL